MEYVYILTSRVRPGPREPIIKGFMILGVYSDYEVCKKEQKAYFESICKSRENDIAYRTENVGLVTTKGGTKVCGVHWNDGQITEYSIQERILDQVTYSSSLAP